ncbi:MAG: GNAT family N-acetyltransferase [Lachnospiraceae bacterium]|nr:GNAT family N-acetyltransferase [Lachnospiraceae bacterium]
MNVRRADEKDIPEILQLLVQVDMVHHNGRPDLFKGPATKYTADELKGIIKDDQTPVFVCVEQNGSEEKVLGHAFCQFEEQAENHVLTGVKTLYIDDICVDEKARRCGVGRMLYDHVIGFAKEAGCYHVTLNVWSCNPGAMRFYESLGMAPYKTGMEKIL